MRKEKRLVILCEKDRRPIGKHTHKKRCCKLVNGTGEENKEIDTENVYIYRYIPRHLSRVAQGFGGAQSDELEVDLFGPDAHENATPKL